MKPILVFRHQPHIAVGIVGDFIEQSGASWEYLDLFDRLPADSDFDITQTAGVVILGGAMSVNDIENYPFIRWDLTQIERALAGGVPIMGICLGSQLLARALGAPVTSNPVMELGWYEMMLRPEADDDPLFAGCDPQPIVCQFHGETFALPEGAVHLASTLDCANQAFRYGESAWGFQFHIEMNGEMFSEWLARSDNIALIDSLDYVDMETIRAATPAGLKSMHRLGRTVVGRFAQLCKERG